MNSRNPDKPIRIEYRGIQVAYRRDQVALDIPSLRLEPGEVLGLVGPSGSGKTTLLRFTAGFLSQQKKSRQPLRRLWGASPVAWVEGAIFFDGTDVSLAPPQERNIAMVRQTWDLLPNLTVLETLMLPSALRGKTKTEARILAERVLEELDLTGKAGSRPSELSGGEVQRVALGRLMVRNDAQLYLLDECLNSLDSDLRIRLLSFFRSFLQKRPVTTIWVTHLVDEVRYIAQKIGVMAGGQIVQIGTMEQLISKPANLLVYRMLSGQSPEYFTLLDFIDGHPFLQGAAVALPEIPGYTGQVTVAVRFGSWNINPDGPITGQVLKCSRMGANLWLVTFSIGGWLADIAAFGSFSCGDQVGFCLTADGVLYFDQTGRRIEK